MIATCVAGCDISSHWLDLCILSSSSSGSQRFSSSRVPVERFGNDAAGQAAVIAALADAGAGMVVIEASGGYEAGLLSACWASGQPVARVQAQRVRHFAGARGQKAKTDQIDAWVLAQFGAQMDLAPTEPALENRRLLRALVGRRRVLVTMRADESKRVKLCTCPDTRTSIAAHLLWLGGEIAAFEARIRAAIQASRDATHREQLMRSMPGIGPTTAAVLLAEMPELGTARPGQIAALAGLAPYTRKSGAWRGKSFISGGRKPVRDAIFMAATTAVFKSKSCFADTYQRLRAAGKPHKLALVAVMRKMLETLNAMLRQNQTFNA